MVKLIACILYEEGKTISADFAISSVYDFVDEIIIVDGTKDLTKNCYELNYINDKKLKFLYQEYNHSDNGMNGKQRNVYLNYLKEHHVGDWAVILDADEYIVGMERLKSFLETHEKEYDCLDVHMEHFIGNLCRVDATREKHFVPRRIFKVNKDLFYPEAEHTLPMHFHNVGMTDVVTYYHFGYALNLFNLKDKYENHLKNSNMHSKEFLQEWYVSHAFGAYPTRSFSADNVPKEITKWFGLEYADEMIYFQRRNHIEAKHFLMCNQWRRFFKPKSVLECGCGMAHYSAAFATYDVHVKGFDKSKYAVSHSPYKDQITLWQDSITDFKVDQEYDLVLVLDVLEHLTYEELYLALERLKTAGKTFLTSIPYKSDPNCDLDPTHLIKEEKVWWIARFVSHGFDVSDVPEHFLFKDQLLILKVK